MSDALIGKKIVSESEEGCLRGEWSDKKREM